MPIQLSVTSLATFNLIMECEDSLPLHFRTPFFTCCFAHLLATGEVFVQVQKAERQVLRWKRAQVVIYHNHYHLDVSHVTPGTLRSSPGVVGACHCQVGTWGWGGWDSGRLAWQAVGSSGGEIGVPCPLPHAWLHLLHLIIPANLWTSPRHVLLTPRPFLHSFT